jgi:hypothetical protein
VDLNGDGRLDLVIVNSTSNTVSVLLNTTPIGATTPTFAAQQTFAVGNSPFGVVAADLAGNGRPDLIVTNFNDKTISVLMNTTAPGATSASFLAQQTFAVGTNPQGIAAGDFNGDGKPDIVVTNAQDNTISLLTNTTPTGILNPTFATQTFATGMTPVSVVVADFNGDGRPDIATSNNGDNTVSVLLNITAAGAPSATFFPQVTFAVGGGPLTLVTADFNGDGLPDLAVANGGPISTPGNTVSVLLDTTAVGSHTASFAAQQTFTVGNVPSGLVAGDLDGDGRPDLAVSNFNDNTMSVLTNTTTRGASTVTFAAQQTFTTGAGPLPMTLGDLNGDGRMDLSVANNTDNNVDVLLSTTTPVTTTFPVVAGLFGTQGVQQFNRVTNTFTTPGSPPSTNVTLLAANTQGQLVADFKGLGVWLFVPTTGWQMINGIDAVSVAIDPLGNVTGSWSGFGTGLFRPSLGPTNWRVISPSTATLLAMDGNGDVAAMFPGFGVWLFQPASGFALINGVNATSLAMNAAGQITANFPGFGIGLFLPGAGWEAISATQATALAIDSDGDVAAQFTGTGVSVFNFANNAFAPLAGAPATNASTLGMDANGDVFAAFPSNGVWEFDTSRGWTQLTSAIASLLAVA